jgi:hypothetical protein
MGSGFAGNCPRPGMTMGGEFELPRLAAAGRSRRLGLGDNHFALLISTLLRYIVAQEISS